jgi:hypothetical protein
VRLGLSSTSACLALLAASPAFARDEALVACAWTKAGTSAATLIERVHFDKQYDFEADGSPTVGLLMRIWAACPEEKSQAAKADRGKLDTRSFLKKLKAKRPGIIEADRLTEQVFRCEIRFRDAADATPAAVAWGFGTDLARHQLSYSETLEGHGQTLTNAELNDPDAIMKMLERAQKSGDQAVEVETVAEGRASGRAYRVKDGGGLRSCKLVQPDGSYVNA